MTFHKKKNKNTHKRKEQKSEYCYVIIEYRKKTNIICKKK